MIRPKNLNMERIEELFNEHFTFNKEDLNKGITMWTISPLREPNPKLIEEERSEEHTSELQSH